MPDLDDFHAFKSTGGSGSSGGCGGCWLWLMAAIALLWLIGRLAG